MSCLKFGLHFKRKNLSKFYTVNHGGGGYMKYPSSINFEKEISIKKLFGINQKSSKKISFQLVSL